MRNKTLDIMEKLERKLNKLSGLELTACGFPVNTAKAMRYRDRMEMWLAKEIDALCEKANEP